MPIVISGTNGISGVDGTASSPALEGTDANTGVFFPAADTVAIATGGSERVRVDSSGNVGIGTNSAAARLDVTGTTNTAFTGSSIRAYAANRTQYVAVDYSGINVVNTSVPNQPLIFAQEGTERMRINAGAPILCLSGGNTSATGTGIAFPATQSASSDANTLDDYEEGTFTPTISGGFSVAPTSYTWQLGRYTKIGRLVYFEIDLDPNGATGNATQIQFSGLPFTSAAAPYGGAVVSYNAGFNTNAGDTYIVVNSSTRIDINVNDGTGRNGNAAGVNINTRIILTGVYTTS